MKRTAMAGTGAMMIAAGLAAAPAAAQTSDQEAKTLLVNEDFNTASVTDDDFVSLGACLTAATEPADGRGLGSCADRTAGPVPDSGQDPGFLQLTDSANHTTGAIAYDQPLENQGGLEVTFAQYQYGGTGADGISFFLVDGETELSDVGAFGGSLGYAQHGDEPGVDGAYLGLGLDAWGNFSADSEGRGSGCPAEHSAPDALDSDLNRAPHSIALRGPGSGTDGYCLLDTTAGDEVVGSTDTGDLHESTLSGPISADTVEDAKRRVKLKVSDDPEPKVTVDIDFLDGQGWERALETTVPFEAPETFKFGFASSTGDANDVHLLRHLRVETFG